MGLFTKKAWADDVTGATPITAAELNRIERGIDDASSIQGTRADATLTTETVLASFALPANYLAAGSLLNLRLLGQVSSTATLTYRLRIGATGLVTDALVVQFGASGAGVANGVTSADILLVCVTGGSAGTVTGGGQVQLSAALSGPLANAFAPASADTTVARTVILTVQQSLAQTYTTRAAVLQKIV